MGDLRNAAQSAQVITPSDVTTYEKGQFNRIRIENVGSGTTMTLEMASGQLCLFIGLAVDMRFEVDFTRLMATGTTLDAVTAMG